MSLVPDWWHVDQRVAQAANLLHGAEWRAKVRAHLWFGRLDDFFQELRKAVDDAKMDEAKTSEARETLEEHYNYFEPRRDLLRYQECRDRGLPIGSGGCLAALRALAPGEDHGVPPRSVSPRSEASALSCKVRR